MTILFCIGEAGIYWVMFQSGCKQQFQGSVFILSHMGSLAFIFTPKSHSSFLEGFPPSHKPCPLPPRCARSLAQNHPEDPPGTPRKPCSQRRGSGMACRAEAARALRSALPMGKG